MADEGWTPEHDDGHDSGELLKAAIGYALVGFVRDGETPPPTPPVNWPWHPSWWKPSGDPIRNLEKAGALIAAEIDRLTRSTSLDAPVSDETS